MPNDKKDIMEEFIKSYEICASFINKGKEYKYRIQDINKALTLLITIINENRLSEIPKFYVYNILLFAEVYARKMPLKSGYGNIKPEMVKLYELLAIIKELGIYRENSNSRS